MFFYGYFTCLYIAPDVILIACGEGRFRLGFPLFSAASACTHSSGRALIDLAISG